METLEKDKTFGLFAQFNNEKGKTMANSNSTEGLKTFKLDPAADTNETENVGMLECQPFALVTVFGEPLRGCGNKVSGQYVFSDPDGEVFTVYEWKRTTTYWGLTSGALTPEEFWDSDDVHDFNVGGKSNPAAFLHWLVETVNEYFEHCDA